MLLFMYQKTPLNKDRILSPFWVVVIGREHWTTCFRLLFNPKIECFCKLIHLCCLHRDRTKASSVLSLAGYSSSSESEAEEESSDPQQKPPTSPNAPDQLVYLPVCTTTILFNSNYILCMLRWLWVLHRAVTSQPIRQLTFKNQNYSKKM